MTRPFLIVAMSIALLLVVNACQQHRNNIWRHWRFWVRLDVGAATLDNSGCRTTSPWIRTAMFTSPKSVTDDFRSLF